MKATRKKGGPKNRRGALVEAAVSRWNRPDPVRKRCVDVMEQMRTYLAGVNKVSLLEWARLLYIKHSTRPGIGAEYAAISSMEDVYRFLNKHDGPVADNGLDIAELEEAFKQGLIPQSTFEEMRGWLKDKKEGQC